MKTLLTTILTIFTAALYAQPCQTTIIKDIGVSNFQATHSGELMTVQMTLVLDNLSLRSDQQLVLTPAFYASADTIAMPRIIVNGRKQHIMYERHNDRGIRPGDIVVRRKNKTAQTVNYQAVVPFRSWMTSCTAAIFEDDCGCGTLLNQSSSDVLVVKPPFQPLLAFITPPTEKKVFQIEKKARITFVVDKTYLDPSYMQNPRELDSIYNTIQLVRNDPNITITNINIHGTASPESSFAHNTMLASGRANTLKDYVCNMVQLPNSVFSSSYTPENWEELIQYIENNQLPNKSEILAICKDESIEPDAREAKIKKLYPEQYRYMYDNWYPDLRRTTYRVQYEVCEFTVEQAKEIMKTKPQQLSLNELYRVAQTYAPGSADFNEVMEIAVRLYPDDAYANLNAAVTRLAAADYDGARRYLPKAGNSPEALNAQGALLWQEGQKLQAKALSQQAKALSQQAKALSQQAKALFQQAAKQGLEAAKKNLAESDTPN